MTIKTVVALVVLAVLPLVVLYSFAVAAGL